MDDGADLTAVLRAASAGDVQAQAILLPRVYDELHRVAAAYMRRERQGHTLQATALVNEAYLRLASAALTPRDRQHYYAAAAQMMRRVLVDHARARGRDKRGGDQLQVTLQEDLLPDDSAETDLLILDEALTRLAAFDERAARGVELLFFAGMSYDEIAGVLGIAKSTVFEDVRMAKAWLAVELGA